MCLDKTTTMFSCTARDELIWMLNDQIIASYTDQDSDIIRAHPTIDAVAVLLSASNNMLSSILLLSEFQNDDYNISCGDQITTVDVEGTI